MNIQVNIEALQSYLVEDRTIQLLAGIVHDALNQSDHFSVEFEISRLKFGSRPPAVNLISMRDIDVGVQWKLRTHDIVIPGLEKVPFHPPCQAVIEIHCNSDFRMFFNAVLSYDGIAPGAIRYRLSGHLSDIVVNGRLLLQSPGDALVLSFESRPEFGFKLGLQLGREDRLVDENHIRDLLTELMNNWLARMMLDGNAVRIPFHVDD
jgi:hypothetical protein